MKTVFLMFLFFLASVQAQESGFVTSVMKFQKRINSEFRDPATTPLLKADRKGFRTLEFFPVDSDFRVVAEFVRTPHETAFQMLTTTDRKPVYVKYGEVYFELQGREYKLNVYQNQELVKSLKYRDYLFLPFTDLTNGDTSYSGGRYLDISTPVNKEIILDFNKAYNPYCAYNGEYSCPIPPAENHLDLPVKAGVMDYKTR